MAADESPGRLIFHEDFQAADSLSHGEELVAAFAIDRGALVGTQVRLVTAPAREGHPSLHAHPAVYAFKVPTRDCLMEVRLRFDGSTMAEIAWDDRNYTGSSYGHICRAQLYLDRIVLIDERDGLRSNAYHAIWTDPSQKDKRSQFLAGRSVEKPVQLVSEHWYTVAIKITGEVMSASIDGVQVALLKSSGIAHPTKARIYLGVAGAVGRFDDLKVWDTSGLTQP